MYLCRVLNDNMRNNIIALRWNDNSVITYTHTYLLSCYTSTYAYILNLSEGDDCDV